MMDGTLGRRCAAEFAGTFAIVFFGCGAMATLNHQGTEAHLSVNLVFGMVVAAMIYALGHISAAHFNPAVTLGFAAAGHFPMRWAPAYIASQLAGGVAASALHSLMLGTIAASARFGATIPNTDSARALAVEAVLTLFLMLVIISVATDKRVHRAIPGAAIGLTVALCGLFGGPLTGCSMNPARSFGPALFGGAMSSLWIYVAGPIVGAVIGGMIYERMRGTEEPTGGRENKAMESQAEAGPAA